MQIQSFIFSQNDKMILVESSIQSYILSRMCLINGIESSIWYHWDRLIQTESSYSWYDPLMVELVKITVSQQPKGFWSSLAHTTNLSNEPHLRGSGSSWGCEVQLQNSLERHTEMQHLARVVVTHHHWTPEAETSPDLIPSTVPICSQAHPDPKCILRNQEKNTWFLNTSKTIQSHHQHPERTDWCVRCHYEA